MKRIAVLAVLTVLGGCVAFNPDPLRVTDPAQYAADVAFCTSPQISTHKPTFDIGQVGYGALSGAAQSGPGGVVGGGLVVGVGAIGGATSAAATGLDAFGKAGNNLSRHCLYDTTMQDRSAVLARPED